MAQWWIQSSVNPLREALGSFPGTAKAAQDKQEDGHVTCAAQEKTGIRVQQGRPQDKPLGLPNPDRARAGQLDHPQRESRSITASPRWRQQEREFEFVLAT